MNSEFPYIIYYSGLFLVIFFLSKFIFSKYYSFLKRFSLLNLYNSSTKKKVKHNKSGGIIYAIILMVSTLSLDNLDFVDFKKISPEIATSILIVFFGFYKDFLKVSNFQKYILLTFFISMLVYSSAIDIYNNSIIDNLNGFLGIYEINPISSFIINFLFYLSVINAISRLGNVTGYLTIFSLLFFISMLYINDLNDFYTLSSISTIIIGVCVFFIFNNFLTKTKILVGDSGSFFMGFWIAYFIIQYVMTAPNSNLVSIFSIKLENIPVIALSLISIPIYDMMRVILIRVIRFKSPFSEDKRWHLHHILLDSGMSELRTSLFLSFINCFNCILIFLIEPSLNSKELILVFTFISLFWYAFFEFVKQNKTKSIL